MSFFVGGWVVGGGGGETYQVSDHDFPNISLIPTLMLITQIPDKVDDSWYKGVSCITLKLTATSQSTSIHAMQLRLQIRWCPTMAGKPSL